MSTETEDKTQDKPEGELETLAEEVANPPKASIAATLQAQRTKTLADQRAKDRDAGRASAQQAFDKEAKRLGFEDSTAMLAALAQNADPDDDEPARPAKPQAAQPRTPKPAAQQVQGDDSELRDELKAAKATIKQLKAQLQSANGSLSQYRSKADKFETEVALRQVAYESDILPDDIEYATSQLQTHFSRLPEEQMKTFDPFKDGKKFFSETLKAKKPSLFREAMKAKEAEKEIEDRPAASSPESGKPKPPNSASAQGNAEPSRPAKAVKDMTRAEFEAHKLKLGINANVH